MLFPCCFLCYFFERTPHQVKKSRPRTSYLCNRLLQIRRKGDVLVGGRRRHSLWSKSLNLRTNGVYAGVIDINPTAGAPLCPQFPGRCSIE
jgi:hypothetical protein